MLYLLSFTHEGVCTARSISVKLYTPHHTARLQCFTYFHLHTIYQRQTIHTLRQMTRALLSLIYTVSMYCQISVSRPHHRGCHPPTSPLPLGRFRPTNGSSGLPQSTSKTASGLLQPFGQNSCLFLTDRQTQRPWNIGNNRPHHCTPCMQCGRGLAITKKQL